MPRSKELDDLLAKVSSAVSWGDPIASLEARNAFNDTPLHTVCFWGEEESVRLLLANGASINARGDKGFTPLHHAVMGENLGVVEMLLQGGADRTLTNDWGQTPRTYAASMLMDAAVRTIDNFKRKDRRAVGLGKRTI